MPVEDKGTSGFFERTQNVTCILNNIMLSAGVRDRN